MSDLITKIEGMRKCGRVFIDAVVPVLEEQRGEAKVDLYNPVADEVIGGLFARTFRLLQTFVLDFYIWADDLGQIVLRLMLESVFYLRFLISHNQLEMFLEFQKYGIGQEKLYKLQLRKLVEEGNLNATDELRDYIDSDSDEEISDELLNVRLKNFEDMRKVATEAGMKDRYVLHYQPESMIVHGHWSALKKYYLLPCSEPLHRFHLQPSFHLPPLNPMLLDQAVELFMDAYELWRKRYGLEDRISPTVDRYFKCCEAVCTSIPEGSAPASGLGEGGGETA